MIFLLYECLIVVVECWPFTREISDNRRRKCLQIPDYYRKCSYDAHTRIVYIYKVSSYRIGIYEKFSDLGDSMSNQSLLALFRTTHLRFCSNFTCLFTSMIEATVPNCRKIGQVFLEIRPPKNWNFPQKLRLTTTSRHSLTNNSSNTINLSRNLNDTWSILTLRVPDRCRRMSFTREITIIFADTRLLS